MSMDIFDYFNLSFKCVRDYISIPEEEHKKAPIKDYIDTIVSNEVLNLGMDKDEINSVLLRDFDDFISKQTVQPGRFARCHFTFFKDNPSRVILIGTRFGTIALYDYIGKKEVSGVYVLARFPSNFPKSIINLFGIKTITDKSMIDKLTGNVLDQVKEPGIGTVLETIANTRSNVSFNTFKKAA